MTGTEKATLCAAGYWKTAGATSGDFKCVLCTTSATGVTECSSATAIKGCKANYVMNFNVCNLCLSPGATCDKAAYTLSGTVTCATGYYKNAALTCAACKTGTALK